MSLSGAPGTFVATFADRTVDDDTLPAFMDPDLDDDGVLNDADAFPEDAARSADADSDGIDDIEDTDDDNDGVPDVDDAFPFDPTRSVDPDTDGDGTPNSVDTDDDGDGVPDAEDAAPLESDVGAFLQIAAPESQLLAVAPGYLADPGFATGIFNGTLHEFTGDGTGQVITPNGNLPLAWTLSGGVLEVVYSPEPDDAEASFLLASDLVELGVANPAEVDTFISTNGDRQVEFTITLGSTSFYLLSDDGNSQQYWVASSEHFQVANDEDRILLFGAIDASARPAIDASESRQLVVDTLTIVSADVGEDVPLDSDRLALPARVVPDESPGRRVQYDIVNFADTGAGSFDSDSEAITWSYDADNRLVINRPDTGGQVVITVLDTLDPGYAVWTLATEGTETYSFFGLAVPDELLADTGDWINPFVGHFVISSYSTTDPAAYDNTGLLQDAFVFGHVLEADGTAPRIVDATAFDGDELFTQRWYWRLEGRELILTGRFQADDEEFYSACDPATDPACMEWRVRHWLPLTVSGDRAYILEWEEISESRDPADPQYSTLITPRTHFYAIHRQDRDSDTFYDIDELLAGLNPDNADSDNDGTDDAFDVFPLNEAESSDVDGDGIGDNADLDDDNDGMPDSFEIEHGLDPLADDGAADKDGDGLSNLAEFDLGSNPDDANDPNTNTGTATLVNISTRGQVRLGDEVMIGGLVIAGDAPMTVLVRARGPGLADFGVPGVLPDPRVSLFLGPDQIGSNDDWQSAGNSGDIPASLRPTNDKASAILVTLEPGAYTAIVEGVGGTTGVGIVEVFEVTATGTAHLVNISTRGFVGDGDDVLIGGLIISGDRPKTIAVTGRGPSLAAFGVPNTLDDPQLSLYDQAGNLLESNDSWQATSRVNDIPAFVSLTDGREAVIVRTVEPGAYTAILSGVGGTSGTGIVEVFEVD